MEECSFHVINSPTGIVLGLDLLSPLGCQIDFKNGDVTFVGAVTEIVNEEKFFNLFEMLQEWSSQRAQASKCLFWPVPEDLYP